MSLLDPSEIKTTLDFYVGQDAESTADELWRVCGDSVLRETNKTTSSSEL